MKINKALNLVIEGGDGDDKFFVHATPLSSDVFDRFAFVFGQVFNAIYTQGAGISGARIAKTVLIDVFTAQAIKGMDLPEVEKDSFRETVKRELENNLFGPIRQTAQVLISVNGKLDQLQIDDAVAAKYIDEDDKKEIENILVFFTVLYHLHRKSERKSVIDHFMNSWDARTVSLSFTEFRNSLQTSTPAANTGKKENPSSIPV